VSKIWSAPRCNSSSRKARWRLPQSRVAHVLEHAYFERMQGVDHFVEWNALFAALAARLLIALRQVVLAGNRPVPHVLQDLSGAFAQVVFPQCRTQSASSSQWSPPNGRKPCGSVWLRASSYTSSELCLQGIALRLGDLASKLRHCTMKIAISELRYAP
jgi:hypothetical protein